MDKQKWEKLWDNILVGLGALCVVVAIGGLLWFAVLDIINWIRNSL